MRLRVHYYLHLCTTNIHIRLCKGLAGGRGYRFQLVTVSTVLPLVLPLVLPH